MQFAILAQSPQEMSQTDRIHPRYFLSRVRVSIRPRFFLYAKKGGFSELLDVVRSFVRSCHGSAGREAGRTARPRTIAHDHARPRTTTHDNARQRTTTHDNARQRTTKHDNARPRMHDRARPRTTAHDRARPRTTDHGCHICLRKRYPPHPRGV